MEAQYAEERLLLEADLHRAEVSAEPVRYGVLYGSGAELVAAVASVLTVARLTTVDLDEALGDTKSADLLISSGQHRRLVGVKAATGSAQESLVGHLQRHMETWPPLRANKPVSGGSSRRQPSTQAGSHRAHRICICPARLRRSPDPAGHLYRRVVQLVAKLRLAGHPFRCARAHNRPRADSAPPRHVPEACRAGRSDAGDGGRGTAPGRSEQPRRTTGPRCARSRRCEAASPRAP